MTKTTRQPKTPNTLCRAGVAAALGLVLCACSTLPQRVDTLEQARTELHTLEQDPIARTAAAGELDAARRAISDADHAYNAKNDLVIIEHDAYMAKQHTAIAAQEIEEAHARQQLAQTRKEPDQIQLQAREREAKQAREKAQSLERQLDQLKAQRTDQGLVLTLGDVLFDTGQAALEPGAMPTIDRLAAFLLDHPERRVLIEGYTDSRGSQNYNLALSQRRADAVGEALEQEGVAATHVRMEGLGEAYPVASNGTAAGMQRNRRVEIVISGPDGRFSDAARNRVQQAQASLAG